MDGSFFTTFRIPLCCFKWVSQYKVPVNSFTRRIDSASVTYAPSTLDDFFRPTIGQHCWEMLWNVVACVHSDQHSPTNFKIFGENAEGNWIQNETFPKQMIIEANNRVEALPLGHSRISSWSHADCGNTIEYRSAGFLLCHRCVHYVIIRMRSKLLSKSKYFEQMSVSKIHRIILDGCTIAVYKIFGLWPSCDPQMWKSKISVCHSIPVIELQ